MVLSVASIVLTITIAIIKLEHSPVERNNKNFTVVENYGIKNSIVFHQSSSSFVPNNTPDTTGLLATIPLDQMHELT